MRPSYIVVAAASILSAHHDTLTASAANDVALTGVVSLGFLQLVGADQRISDEPRFLRGNKIAEGDNEERRFAENSKDLVNKLLKTNSFSALKNTDSLVVLKKAEALSDDHMKGVFKFASNAGMRPADLNKILKELPEADDAIRAVAVKEYTSYLKKIERL